MPNGWDDESLPVPARPVPGLVGADGTELGRPA